MRITALLHHGMVFVQNFLKLVIECSVLKRQPYCSQTICEIYVPLNVITLGQTKSDNINRYSSAYCHVCKINAAAQKRLQQFLAENDIVTQPSTHSDRPSRSCRPSTSQQIPPNCQATSTSRASINDDLWTEDQSTVSGNETLTETKTVYLKKIECQINQSPLDQVVK